MKPNLLAIVSDLSTLSQGARRITERLVGKTNKDAVSLSSEGQLNEIETVLVKDLAERLKTLEERCRDLTEALEEAHDVSVSDSELADFCVTITERLKDSKSAMLIQAYDAEYFQAQPRSLRSAIAECLLNIFYQRNHPAPELWTRMSINGGVI